MSARTVSIPEGGTGRVKLDLGTTQDALSNSLNTYTITLGTATQADLSGIALTGTPTVSGAELYVDITAAEDSTTAGSRTFTISISAFGGAITQTWNGTIVDRWIASPTASITSSHSSSGANEGDTVTFSVTATNINAGDTLAYTLTGAAATSSDVGAPLTGTLTFGPETSNTTLTASLNVPITADATTEPSPEVLGLTITQPSPSFYTITNTANTTINDTSQDPTPVYNLTGNDVTEGGTITFNFTATNTTIPDGTTIFFTITSSDSRYTGVTSGSFTTTSNAGSFTGTTTGNNLDEGTGTVTANITTSPYNTASTSVSIFDDDPADFNKFVTVPLSWSATYNNNDSQLVSCVPHRYIRLIEGDTGTGTEVPTAVSVTKGNPSTITITATQLVDLTANQGGYSAKLLTAFNNCNPDEPITGTQTDAIGYDITSS